MKLLAKIVLWSFVVAAALGPFLANDRPIIASVAGKLQFPCVDSYFGEQRPGPGDQTWKHWWLDLDDATSDWAIMPPWPHGPIEISEDAMLAGPSLEHPLGNDDTGRDQLSRLIHGACTALMVALGTVLLALLIGVPLGALAGLYGGWADVLVLRLVEIFRCFPGLLAILAASAFFGGSIWVVILVLGLVSWPSFTRIVRGEFLSLREREFVQVARGLGIRGPRLFFRHMLPCIKGQVYVTAAFMAASAIVAEATLAFLGINEGLSRVSWGAMLDQGRVHAAARVWHLWLFPALALSVVILSFHAIADRPRRVPEMKS